MFKEVILVSILAGFITYVYRALRPPPPKVCGTPGGPLITGPRVKLRDGRHLSYKEHGVPKETAKYKIIYLHGHHTNKHDAFLATSRLMEELEVYMVSFDRQGYGESDPDPKRTIKSTALDIEELADQLGLGHQFYVVGYSAGGILIWGCLKYIPHRLAGAALVAPGINFRWPGLPKALARKEFSKLAPMFRWTQRIAYYAPWLIHWWNTQKLFTHKMGRPPPQDLAILAKLGHLKEYSVQQGTFESYSREDIVLFGKWEFDPMDLHDPFATREGSVHLWQGDKDVGIPIMLQRYIAKKLSWIHYHEVPDRGHLFPYSDDIKDVILRTLLKGGK